MARHASVTPKRGTIPMRTTSRKMDVSIGGKAGSVDNRSLKEVRAEWLLDRQIDLPLYVLLSIFVAHALSGTSSFSLPHLSTRLPHSLQTLLPHWARHLPILAPFATDLPNASRDSKYSPPGESYWSTTTTGYAGPFRSDAVGFGHPLTALYNLTSACLGLSYEVRDKNSKISSMAAAAFGSSYASGDLQYGQSYYDRYPWNSWTSSTEVRPNFLNRTYEKGLLDIWFVLTGVLLFTVLRALVVRYVLFPLAHLSIPAAKKTKSRAEAAQQVRQRRRMCTRFAEQAWIALWGTISLASSLYVAANEPYWNSELALWTNWPYKQLSGLTKTYYLCQTAFWVQQVIVINVEDRRKDHWQMFSHHIVTIMLLLGSYGSHFTPIGNVILVLMDPCDILLAMAKCLRYAGTQLACDISFGLFMLVWILTRHLLYNRALYSCIAVARAKLPEIPGATAADYWGFRTFMGLSLVVLLCVLQVILCIWLALIVRVAWRVVTGKGATDTRSDEDSDEEELDASKASEDPQTASRTTAPATSLSASSTPHLTTASSAASTTATSSATSTSIPTHNGGKRRK